jgi:hypothetical protein
VTEAVGDLDIYLALWEQRSPEKPTVPTDGAGPAAVDAIDAALRDPYTLRSRLVTEIRDHQDAGNARVDAMIAARRAERS